MDHKVAVAPHAEVQLGAARLAIFEKREPVRCGLVSI